MFGLQLGLSIPLYFQSQGICHMVLNIMEEGKIHLTTQSNIFCIRGQEKHLKQTCMTSQSDYFLLSLHIGTIRDFIIHVLVLWFVQILVNET